MWPDSQETPNLVTFTEEILNGKFHVLCSVSRDLPSFFLMVKNGQTYFKILRCSHSFHTCLAIFQHYMKRIISL